MKSTITTVVALAAMVAVSGAAIITHTGADDIFLRESAPTTAQGDTRNLFGGQKSDAQFVTLMKFSLADVYTDLGATGGTITSVQLNLGPAMTSGDGNADYFEGNLYQYTDFDAATATWNDPDGTAGSDATPGGTFGTALATETFYIADTLGQGFASTSALVAYLQTAYDAGDAEVFFRLGNDGTDVGVNAFMRTDSGTVTGTGQASLAVDGSAAIPEDPPVWQVDPIWEVAYYDLFFLGTLAGKAVDPNDDPITYSLVGASTWLDVAANGVMSGTPLVADLGTNTFTVAATDGISGTNEATLNIIVAAVPANQTLLVEAESFSEKGGWVVDQQFMQAMGSPYLLAHGLGEPVADAVTTVSFPGLGTYKMWVRTKDWVPGAWDAPGRFEVLIDGTAIGGTFGTTSGWSWQEGGTIDVTNSQVQISLHDLTGFDGRCDALYFDTNTSAIPSEFDANNPQINRQWRNGLLGLPAVPPNGGTFDVVIVGGGVTGCAAALAANNEGLSVALIHDRPVLGGNASGEVRVATRGVYGPSEAIVSSVNNDYSGNGNPQALVDDVTRENAMASATGVTIFRNYRAYDVQTNGSRITSVDACSTLTGEALRIFSDIFIDSTGDGWIGYWAGADYRYGRESKTEFGEDDEGRGELWSPTVADNRVMGTSVLWYSSDMGTPSAFPAVSWAEDVADTHSASAGEWSWEYSDNAVHQIDDFEQVRDHMLRAIYGSFSNYKNNGGNPNQALDWVAYIAGKRESRRLMGDYIYTRKDMADDTQFRDSVIVASWPNDVHHQQILANPATGDFLSTAWYGSVPSGGYYVPFRCFYSRNIENLMMAGRNFSCSHIGLGGPRVMNTCGQMGVAVGYAAALCKQHGIDPRGIYENSDRTRDLQTLIGGSWPQQSQPEAPSLELIMDNDGFGMQFEGSWTHSTFDSGYYGDGYHHDGNTGKGTKSATFSVTSLTNANFSVDLRWVAGLNRASNVPVWVQKNEATPSGSADFIINQQSGGTSWHSLTNFALVSYDTVYVILGTDGTDGYVIADAMRLYLPDEGGAAPDADSDGMPDFWEGWYLPTATASDPTYETDGDPTDDPDGDGHNNLEEFRAGTDPLTAGSIFKIVALDNMIGEDYSVSWTSVAGKSYRIEYTDNLADDPFLPVPGAEGIAATPPENSYTVVLDVNQRFYRVVVED